MSDGPARPPRVLAGTLAELERAGILVVRLRAGPNARPREALLLRDETGALRAYRNECRHLPIPLDAASRSFFFRGHLQCATHGARYRLSDGLCVAGPCQGARLHPLESELVGDELYVLDHD